MWPIRDIAGEVVGFGARKLRDDDNGPKYLNTPETPLYRKSQVLYGIDLAKKEIAKTNRAVVVEGYTDVMACHLAGVTTAIATCGTSFGEGHIKILRRLLMDNAGSEVVFTFDGDAAGQKAALRAFEDDQKFAAETSIAITPGGMDPCDLRLAKGDAAVADLVEARTPLFEFALRHVVSRHNLDTTVGRAAALDEAAPIVANIKNSSIQHESAVQLAGMLGILDTQFVVRRVSQLARWARERGRDGGPDQGRQQRRGRPQAAEQARPAPGPRGPALNLRSPAHRVERELLKLALQRPDLVSPAFDAYGADEFTAPPYAVVRQCIEDAGGTAAGAARQRVRPPGAGGGRRRHRPRHGHRTRRRTPAHPPRPRRGLCRRPVGRRPPRRRQPPRHRNPRHPPAPRPPRRPRTPRRRTERTLGPPAVRPVPARTRLRRPVGRPNTPGHSPR